MPESNRNRHSVKSTDNEDQAGNNKQQDTRYKKLPDNPNNRSDESISTADDSATGKYSRTNVRDEDIDNENTRGGR